MNQLKKACVDCLEQKGMYSNKGSKDSVKVKKTDSKKCFKLKILNITETEIPQTCCMQVVDFTSLLQVVNKLQHAC